jgi:hypothetical protein
VPDHPSHHDTTRATAKLPGLEIEIVHRRRQGSEAEALSITLHAVPSFEAFGRESVGFLGAGHANGLAAVVRCKPCADAALDRSLERRRRDASCAELAALGAAG